MIPKVGASGAGSKRLGKGGSRTGSLALKIPKEHTPKSSKQLKHAHTMPDPSHGSMTKLALEFFAEKTEDKERGVGFFDEWASRVPLFKKCDKLFLEEVMGRSRREVHRKDMVFVQQGAEFQSMIVIIRGEASLHREDILVGFLEAGSPFGQANVTGRTDRSEVTVTATTTCLTQVLDKSNLMEVLAEWPSERARLLEDKEMGAVQMQYSLFASVRSSVARAPTTKRHVPLSEVPIFCGSSQLFLARLSKFVVSQVYFPDEIIVDEDIDEEQRFLMLTEGRIALERNGRKVSEKEAPEFFGELSVLGIRKEWTFTQRSRTVCYLQMIHRRCLLEALSAFPEEEQKMNEFIMACSNANVEHDIKALKECLFFKQCSVWFLTKIREAFDERLYVEGQAIITEGEDGDCFFILATGQVVVSATGEQEHKHATVKVGATGHQDAFVRDEPTHDNSIHFQKVLGPGSVFGEMAVLGISSKRIATVTAAVPCLVLILYRADLSRALEHCKQERHKFLDMAAQRLDVLQGSNVLNTKRTARVTDHPFFRGCGDAFLAKLRERMEQRIFMPGDFIVQEGEEGDCMFLLMEGSAVALSGGTRIGTIDARESISLIGELACLGLSKERTATVVAETVCVAQVLGCSAMLELLSTHAGERKRLEKLVQEHLQYTVYSCISAISIFKGCDTRFITLLVMNVDQKIHMPNVLVVNEDCAFDSLLVINKGHADAELDGENLGPLSPGNHFAATCMLGTTTLPPSSLRTVTMCHVLLLSFTNFYNCFRQYHPGDAGKRDWLQVIRESETARYEHNCHMLKRRVRQRKLVRRIEKTYVSNSKKGAADPRLLIPAFSSPKELGKVKLEKEVFDAWYRIVQVQLHVGQNKVEPKDGPKAQLRNWVEKRQILMDRVRPQREMQALVQKTMHSRGPLPEICRSAFTSTARNARIGEKDNMFRKTYGMFGDACTVPTDWPRPRPSPFYRLRSTNVFKELGDKLCLPPIAGDGRKVRLNDVIPSPSASSLS